jgi:hypothetical protein
MHLKYAVKYGYLSYELYCKILIMKDGLCWNQEFSPHARHARDLRAATSTKWEKVNIKECIASMSI